MESNKEKRKKWDKKYRETHKEKVKESRLNYAASEKGKEHKHEYYLKNKERDAERKKAYDKKYRENNRDKVNAKHRKWSKTIKGTIKILKHHDARRLGIANQNITKELLNKVYERDKVCVYCGKEFEDGFEHEHINPFKPFSEDNMVLACHECNKSKLNADMIQWMTHKGYKISRKLQELYKKAYNL